MKKLLCGLILLGSYSAFSEAQTCTSLCAHYVDAFKYEVIGEKPLTAGSFDELSAQCRELVASSLNINPSLLVQTRTELMGIGAGDENLTFFPQGGCEITKGKVVFGLLFSSEARQYDGTVLTWISNANEKNSCR